MKHSEHDQTTAWVIEISTADGIAYWAPGVCPDRDFTFNNEAACRFERQEDAQRVSGTVLRGLTGLTAVVEHSWFLEAPDAAV